MLTNALKSMVLNIVFLSVLTVGPFIIPILLLLLAFALFLVVSMVKNWKEKSVRRTAGIVGICVLLLVIALARESEPYSASSAKRLYTSRQTAYDTVAAFMLEQAQEDGGWAHYSNDLREEWPKEIEMELRETLGSWSLRCGNPDVSVRGYSADLEVSFHIYSGPERDSGDGGTVYESQYLLYAPNKSRINTTNSYLEDLIHLTGDWYLYRIVNL